MAEAFSVIMAPDVRTRAQLHKNRHHPASRRVLHTGCQSLSLSLSPAHVETCNLEQGAIVVHARNRPRETEWVDLSFKHKGPRSLVAPAPHLTVS